MATGKIYPKIDNYIYFWHTNVLVNLPVFPQSISDSTSISFASTNILGRSAPIYSFSSSGPRSFSITFDLRRDMLNEIQGDYAGSIGAEEDDDYMDYLIKNIQAAAVPNYSSSKKMIDPPMVTIRIGNDIACKGIINGSVNVTYNLPILRNGKYAGVNISFSVSEIDPYDASMVQRAGSWRPGGEIAINTTLDSPQYIVGDNNSFKDSLVTVQNNN